ncbi:MAG: DinB family protein [Desulfobacterales bacterium]|nr:DinB family protein [Desulfobacterales bacterium]
MDSKRDGIIAELRNNEEEIITFYKDLDSVQLDMTVYAEDDSWTMQQVLAHFITIERSMHWLFKNILAGGPGSPEDFDFERFNRTQPRKLDGLSLNELFEKFRSVRRETIAIVAGMEDQDLDREGRHAFHGHGKLERFIVWAYEHAGLHLDDMRKKLLEFSNE